MEILIGLLAFAILSIAFLFSMWWNTRDELRSVQKMWKRSIDESRGTYDTLRRTNKNLARRIDKLRGGQEDTLRKHGVPLLRNLRDYCEEQLKRPTMDAHDVTLAIQSQIEAVIDYAQEEERYD